ncbi:MAG: calcium/sodium antiporter [Luminiphilus sp.]|nr:calcium/sodium antiporter [Halieaceae bacterium]RPG92031.1 MAG: calcium/sodium antiporter [Cellvibrionales bacterium TMED157]
MLDFMFIAVGLAGLVWSSDKFVEGAAAIANHAGMSPLLIGMTIVSLGTSAPEIVVSIMASLSGSGELAVGNALGSNITNIGLVLGITLIIRSITIDASTTKRELPQMVVVTLLAGALMIDDVLSVTDGALLILGLVIFLTLLARRGVAPEGGMDNDSTLTPLKAWGVFTIGLALLVISSRLLVVGAVNIAMALGVSELIIGLTIVAIGTSLPELAAAVMSALKGHSDIAIGAIVGSNVFNLLVVLAGPGLFGPLTLNASVMTRDWPVTMLTTGTLMMLAWLAYQNANGDKKGNGELGRAPGVLLVTMYTAYIGLLIFYPDLAL